MLACADHGRVIGTVAEASEIDIDVAFAAARAAQPEWDAAGGPARGKVLRAMADALEANRDRLIALAVREAGKTLADGVSEVRGRTCRYYAARSPSNSSPRPPC